MATTNPDTRTVLDNIKIVSERFAKDRPERQRRRELKKEDFNLLREAGFPLIAIPVDFGGIFESTARSTRVLCEMLRILAHGDPSVALVASMHPAVISSGGWTEIPQAPEPFTEAWDKQRKWIFQTSMDGHWWGTIISEPGSGGDPSKSKAVARKGDAEGEYFITGQKHFGSGSGMTSFMVTLAIPEGESEPELFFMDMRDRPWDGTAGMKLMAPWDGHGMTATQSHGMIFEDMPATRTAWPGSRAEMQRSGSRPAGLSFTSVIVGIVETAVETARQQLSGKKASMSPFEQVEWSRIQMENWLIHQAYEGALREVEEGTGGPASALICKETVAELSESLMLRLSKVVGGSSYSRNFPYGFWLEDVRALGFLRPPWGFAFERIFNASWTA